MAYELELDKKFYRVFSVITDKHGIDPLQDRVVPAILSITSYTVHEVTQDERGSPDLISLREYGTEDFWWHILTYNGICSYKDITEGVSLKIPQFGALIAATNDSTSDRANPNVGTNIITI